MSITNIYKGISERSDIDKIYKGTTLLYEKVLAPQGETWVFNDTIDASGNLWFYLYFTCDGKQGNGINTDEGWLNYSGIAIPVYTESGWKDEVYKTITITSKLSEVTGDEGILAWLQSNAVKQ